MTDARSTTKSVIHRAPGRELVLTVPPSALPRELRVRVLAVTVSGVAVLSVGADSDVAIEPAEDREIRRRVERRTAPLLFENDEARQSGQRRGERRRSA